MGFAPGAVDQMSLWEFGAIAHAYAQANGAQQEISAPSYEEHIAMVSELKHS